MMVTNFYVVHKKTYFDKKNPVNDVVLWKQINICWEKNQFTYYIKSQETRVRGGHIQTSKLIYVSTDILIT